MCSPSFFSLFFFPPVLVNALKLNYIKGSQILTQDKPNFPVNALDPNVSPFIARPVVLSWSKSLITVF